MSVQVDAKKIQRWTIPDTWSWTISSEVAQIIGGGTPSTKETANFDGGEIPWITPADLTGYREKMIRRGERNITEKGLRESGARLMPTGTVLFSSRAPIGYVAIADNPVATNQGFKSFIPSEAITSDFLYYYMQFAKPIAIEMASGTTFLEISGAKAAQIPVPIASLREQKEIVSEIEKQFTRLDAATAALKRVQVNLKRYRASVLKAACEGRLVPTEAELARKEGREYEQADKLLQRILRERRARWEADSLAKMQASSKPPINDDWKQKYKEPSAPDTSDLPTLPEGWCWATVDQISTLVTDGDHNPPKRVQNGVPHLTARNVRNLALDLEECTYISQQDAIEVFKRYEPRARDIIITCVGTIGRLAVVPEDILFSPDRNLAALRLVQDGVLVDFVLYQLSSPRLQTIMSSSSGSTAQPHLYLGDIRTIPLAIPPEREQKELVRVLAGKLSLIDHVGTEIEVNLKAGTKMRQSILRRAFTGQLVPQDPTDEPASALLERIRAERSSSVAVRPRGGRRAENTYA